MSSTAASRVGVGKPRRWVVSWTRADVISFGVAPAAIAYGAGMDGLWDRVILLYFVACGVSRLARYNITADALAEDGDKVKYFEGTPIPSSLLLVIVIAFAAASGAIGDGLWFGMVHLGPWQLHPVVLLFAVSGSLMISRTIHIPKYTVRSPRRPGRSQTRQLFVPV